MYRHEFGHDVDLIHCPSDDNPVTIELFRLATARSWHPYRTNIADQPAHRSLAQGRNN